MTALSPVSLQPVGRSHRQHHQPHDALREAKRPPEPRLHLPWIYILIRKLVGGRGEALRLVMSLFWTPGVFPLSGGYLRPRSADLDQGLTGGER